LLSQILLKRKQSIGRRGGRQEYATWSPPPSVPALCAQEVVYIGEGFIAFFVKNIFSRREEHEN
jgi:hypothetical protein